ncbi:MULTISPECIES: hypothetical protein [Burkholderia]|uniref:hypothetical protein n=1 Tax=Burkholderia TaxID=32008 RepID=UPI000B7A5E72|nr:MULTISPECIES: hypothetical protein [Burkholderia]OXJ03551.1 hypothetical protein CFB41_03690 [Burkholderia sp. AU33803]PRD97047.1 hypothetical protein C6P88_02455 [Burkholderia contaminans]
MSAAGELPASPQAAHDARFDCLEAPVPRGAAWVRAYLVDRLKRAAIRRLHRSVHGERWVLRMYLIGEEATECALHEDWTGQPPDWLAPRIEQHLADERRHAAAFADALRERGVAPSAAPHEPDWLSRRKIMRWRRLARRHAPHFSQGVLVPAYATGLCAEQMAMRVLARHCATIGDAHPLYPLLSRVLADEMRHVRLCSDTLRRLVAPSEAAHLAALLNEIRAIEAGFGVTGALAMVAAGWFQSLRPRA